VRDAHKGDELLFGVPRHVWALVKPYGLSPTPEEVHADTGASV